MWGVDEMGSTGYEDVCRDDFRGPKPFSEPETQAMRDFVEQWDNIKIAINLHAYGNLLVYPFNYDDKVNGKLRSEFRKAADFYNDI
jgi:carboxypeptidase T